MNATSESVSGAFHGELPHGQFCVYRFPVDTCFTSRCHVGVVVMPNAHLESTFFPLTWSSKQRPSTVSKYKLLYWVDCLDGQNLMF